MDTEVIKNNLPEEADVLEVADDSIEKNVRMMSPGQMVLRRFFRSKLSIIGLLMIVSLFLFCWVGPLIYTADPTAPDYSGKIEYTETTITDENGNFEFDAIQGFKNVYINLLVTNGTNTEDIINIKLELFTFSAIIIEEVRSQYLLYTIQ